MSDWDDIAKQLSGAKQEFIKAFSPFIQQELALRNQTAFQKKAKDYYDNEINLSKKEIESIILAISSGKNTFKDLQDIVPNINSPTMMSYLCNIPEYDPQYRTPTNTPSSLAFPSGSGSQHKCYFQLKEVPKDFYTFYEFKPDDTFMLSILGENILYQLEKEEEIKNLSSRSIKLAEESLSVAKESTKYARLAFYAAVIFGLLSVMPDVKEKLWHWLQLLLGLSL